MQAKFRHSPCGFLLGALLLHTSAACAAGPFTGFAGSWRGGGEIILDDGSREAVRCKATYSPNGEADALDIDVSCAGNSFKVHILSRVTAQGGQFSGSWQETIKEVQGSVSGRIPAPGQMQASFEAMGVGIQLAARTDGRQQSITLRSQGTEIRSASITLRRS